MSLICVVAWCLPLPWLQHPPAMLPAAASELLTLMLSQICISSGGGICILNHQECLHTNCRVRIHFTKYSHLFLPPFPNTVSRIPFLRQISRERCVPPPRRVRRAVSKGKIYSELDRLPLFKNPCTWKSVVESGLGTRRRPLHRPLRQGRGWLRRRSRGPRGCPRPTSLLPQLPCEAPAPAALRSAPVPPIPSSTPICCSRYAEATRAPCRRRMRWKFVQRRSANQNI